VERWRPRRLVRRADAANGHNLTLWAFRAVKAFEI